MAGMITNLIEILNEQTERHTELLGLSNEEKDAIVQNDIDTLQKLVNLKNIVISQNNKLEKKRLSLVADIAEVLALKDKDIDIKALADMLEGKPEQAELMEAGKKLRDVVIELKEINDLNKELLENALGFVEYSLNALRSVISPEPAEVPIGKPVNVGNVTGMFDTRS